MNGRAAATATHRQARQTNRHASPKRVIQFQLLVGTVSKWESESGSGRADES